MALHSGSEIEISENQHFPNSFSSCNSKYCVRYLEMESEWQKMYVYAVDAFKLIQDKTNQSFEQLGEEKQKALNGSLERFAALIARVETANDDYVVEINGKDIELVKIGYSVFGLSSMLSGVIAAGGAGTLAGLGAFGRYFLLKLW
ncbi:hypothetical protein [Campylobacter porcelli]|uniref:Uncharacterized protein n=1 Tax=Campylobacter porcelli TaxID=1660073 RepID=A0ABU7M6C1_9BACT|nr:hypothetical protein [Campylobacter sp. CX2-4855-23]